MFVGHYGPAFAGKRFAASVPLWTLFVAVQLVDFAWGIFVANGIEHVRIVEGFTDANPLDLYHMPWTHSLVAALGWSVAAGWIYSLLARTDKRSGGVVIALAVFSHWILDLIVHVPDLALWPGGPKVGFGLWNNYPLAASLEAVVLIAGFLLYLGATRARGVIGRVWPWTFMALLGGAEYVNHTMPTAPDASGAGYMAVATFAVIAGLAAICDLTRRPA